MLGTCALFLHRGQVLRGLLQWRVNTTLHALATAIAAATATATFALTAANAGATNRIVVLIAVNHAAVWITLRPLLLLRALAMLLTRRTRFTRLT